MQTLLAMCFEGAMAPSVELLHPAANPDVTATWGLGAYEREEPVALVSRSRHALAPLRCESPLFLFQRASPGIGSPSASTAQPFTRNWGGREWMFVDASELGPPPPPLADALFEPLGHSRSERVFCELLNRIAERKWRSLDAADPALLAQWLRELNAWGTLNLALTDGRELLVYGDQHAAGLTTWELLPPYGQAILRDGDLTVDLTHASSSRRKAFCVSNAGLQSVGEVIPAMRTLAPGTLLLVRHGSIRAELIPADAGTGATALARAPARPPRPQAAEVKRLEVVHRTTYRYATPVQRSMHLFRLTPAHDRLQNVLQHKLELSVDCEQRDYEDVFGNRVRRIRVDKPFQEFTVEARSQVELLDTDPLSFRPLRARSTIPLVWMPWQRHMLAPYLLPPELPESQLSELTDYAMNFVERNDFHLLETLLDINTALFREYRYTPGSTSLSTTPFQVYSSRQGVCQDFAQLFICMMRLLGVPARYACGYLLTRPGPNGPSMSDASHAWVQVYLPEVGWRGFDPTNGVLTQTEHIRVATGRNYSDATPTSGVIYAGGGGESMDIHVKVTAL